ncbi:hypothetical protein DER46DRAFT_624743 [Fusarium sp. MPI-SDFR-AT-0072]|nr:hypothetical protein DER46DRAFT_624743 [Fusarium sp. MPI-SDFR-AT-0072]
MYYPEIGIGNIMTISMGSSLTTSALLEIALLHYGQDKLGWIAAAKTAVCMIDYHLTGGAVHFDSPQFWLATIISMGAGFLTSLPYNYLRLRKYGKACH